VRYGVRFEPAGVFRIPAFRPDRDELFHRRIRFRRPTCPQ
jgi:hypothetical protein